jgi:hypothetical protein
MRRILDTQRAWIDAGRVLAYQTALELDLARHHTDPVRRERAQRWCSLVTPVLKSAFTEQAFHGGSDCLQVFGGHGYVREWGIEQVLRDARIAMIYEGTNEIQAIDLLVRKVMGDKGQALTTLLAELQADLAVTDADAAQQAEFARMATALNEATAQLLARAATAPDHVYWVAGDYLRALALVLLAWSWARIDKASTGADARWAAPSQALRAWVLPEFDMRLRLLTTVA